MVHKIYVSGDHEWTAQLVITESTHKCISSLQQTLHIPDVSQNRWFIGVSIRALLCHITVLSYIRCSLHDFSELFILNNIIWKHWSF